MRILGLPTLFRTLFREECIMKLQMEVVRMLKSLGRCANPSFNDGTNNFSFIKSIIKSFGQVNATIVLILWCFYCSKGTRIIARCCLSSFLLSPQPTSINSLSQFPQFPPKHPLLCPSPPFQPPTPTPTLLFFSRFCQIAILTRAVHSNTYNLLTSHFSSIMKIFVDENGALHLFSSE